jgi:ribosomal protein S15P/S13E
MSARRTPLILTALVSTLTSHVAAHRRDTNAKPRAAPLLYGRRGCVQVRVGLGW